MSNEIGSGYSGGDYSQADFWNGEEAAHNIAKVDSPNTNKNRVRADHFNDVAAELVAVQKRLGAGIRGAQNSLEERLDRGLNTYGDPGGWRYTIGFDDLKSTVKNNTTSPVSGVVCGEPSHTETLLWDSDEQGIELEDDTTVLFPKDYKIDIDTGSARVSGAYGIYAEGKKNIIIEGGEIDGNSVALHSYQSEFDHAITLKECENVIIRNMYIHDMPGDGIYINDCTNIWIENCIIDVTNKQIGDSEINFIGRNPISVIRGENIYIRNNVITGGLPAGIDLETNSTPHHHFRNIHIENNLVYETDCHGISVSVSFGPEEDPSYGEDIYIVGNVIRDCVGVGLGAFGDGEIRRLFVLNNTIDNAQCTNPYTGGSYETATSLRGNIKYSIFENNIINDSGGFGFYYWSNYQNKVIKNKIINPSGYGIFVYKDSAILEENIIDGAGDHGIAISAGLKYIRLIKNIICNCEKNGITIDGTSANKMKYCQVIGNECYNNSQASAGTYDGIQASYHENSVIADNYCYDNQDTPTQKYGLEFTNSLNTTFGRIDGFGNQSGYLFRYKSNENINIINAKCLGTWVYENVPANLSNTVMSLAGQALGKMYTPFGGHLIYFSAYATANVTAGTITCRAVLDGTLRSTAVLSTDDPNKNYSEVGDPPRIFEQGDLLHCEISSDADLLPDGSIDVFCQMWII